MTPSAESAKPADTDGLNQNAVDEAVRRAPLGAMAMAGVSTFIAVAIVILFYFCAYLQRGIVQ